MRGTVDVKEPAEAVVVRTDQKPVPLQVGAKLEGRPNDGNALLLGHAEVPLSAFENAANVSLRAVPTFLLLLQQRFSDLRATCVRVLHVFVARSR